MKPVSSRARRQKGQALLVLLMVLLLGGLYGFVDRIDAGLASSIRAGDDSLARAKEALLWYAATYRDSHDAEVPGYLPCPDSADESGLFVAGDGIAAATCGGPAMIAVGLLPYRTLGLPDLRDADGNCLWYAVSGTFKNAPKAALPLDWDAQAQLGVVTASGTALAAPDDADGGAAAIVFSPGPALPGQERRPFGQACGVDPAQASAYLESVAPTFVGGDATDANGRTTRNDRLVWLAPREIFSRVVARADFGNPLGSVPEGWLSQLIDAQRKALEGRLWSGMATLTAASSGTPGTSALPANLADYDQFAGKLVGDVPDLAPLAYQGRSHDNVLANWREQFRYVVCDDLRPISGCVAAGARRCRGALLFAGRSSSGGPRPSSLKPHAPPPSRSAWLGNYFEAGGGLELLAGPALSLAAATRYDAATPSADVGVCLSPGGFTSFAKDIAGYTRAASSALHPEAAIDTAAKTLTLGNPAATVAGSGCAWFPAQLPFSTSLRAYFKLRIADAGEGFTFAVLDGAANAAAMSAGTLCGSAVGSQLGYSGPLVAPSKFGLEFDTRTQATGNCSGSNRNDPSSQHMAFVFWGATGTDSDDNCHGAGTADSGTQPLNPRSLGNGIRTVQASDPHLPYAGSFPLDTDIHVRLDVRKRFDGAQVAAGRWSSTDGNAVLVTATPHGLASGQRVTVSDVNPPGYNGTFVVTVPDGIRISYSAADPSAYVSGGHVAAPTAVPVAAASWAAGTVTLVTAAAHGFVEDQPVSLSGTTPSAYDGTYAVKVVDPTQLRFAIGADPGAYVSGGSLTAAVGLELKAYVASKFLVFGSSYVSTCTATDFQDLSQDLGDLCTQNATLAMENVHVDVDATTARALAQVYVGFTTAQSTGAAGRQRLTISGFLANVQ